MKNLIKNWLGIISLETKAKTNLSHKDIQISVLEGIERYTKREKKTIEFKESTEFKNYIHSEEFLDGIIKRIKDKQL